MEYVLYLVVLAVVTVIVRIVQDKIRTAGILKIDHSNPEKDVYRLEIDDLESLSKKHKIVLKVDNRANLSQE